MRKKLMTRRERMIDKAVQRSPRWTWDHLYMVACCGERRCYGCAVAVDVIRAQFRRLVSQRALG